MAEEDDDEEMTEETVEDSEEAPKEEKKKKQRKVVRRRKTKKEKEKPLTSAIRLAVESGKTSFGARSGLTAGATGNAKLFVVASNTPPDIMEKMGKYSSTSKVPLIIFEGSSMELGSVCGKPYPISVLSIYETGTSPILELAK